MACLSVFHEGIRPAVIAANPIYITSSIQKLCTGAKLIFEVLENDAAMLKRLLGETRLYYLDEPGVFWARLESLEPCKSTHTRLAALAIKPTLRGVLTVLEEARALQ